MEDEEGLMEAGRFRCEVTTAFVKSCASGTKTFFNLGERLGESTLLGSSTTAFFGVVY